MNEQLLKEQIETQRNLLSTDRLDLSFGEITRMYQDGDIIIKPAFQRYFRWDIDQRTRFIESILLGIPIPPIFVAADGNGVWELVDGLQRVSTMLSFFGVLKSEDEGIKNKNNWILVEGDRVEALTDFTYETMPELFKRSLKRATCRVEILNWNSSYDMRFELFNRLNTGGSPLTAQEIRNCIYRDISTEFNDFLKRISNNKDFLELINLDDEQIERLYHEELALRFVSLYQNIDNVKTGLAHHMTGFMKKALEDKSFDYVKYETIFSNIFSFLKPLGEEIFHKRGRLITTIYDIITVGVAENYDYYKSQNPKIISEKIKQNEGSIDTIIKSSSGNGQKGRIINRLKESQRIFGNDNK
ncbi:MAG: DUF262 domain-containing protein [Methylococcaceae bacterium]